MRLSQKNVYLETPFILKLSTVDTICEAISKFGCGVKLFKIDLARAFRQLHVDPFDTKFLGLHWWGEYFLDIALPFGYRNGTLACTRVTDLIRFILAKLGIFVLNYIDDIIGVVPDDVANVQFQVTLKVLHLLGFIISKYKTIPPGKIVTCLGIVINLELGCLSIPSIKLNKVVNLSSKYLNKKSILKRDLQALLGSLLFLHKAIKPARTFVNRALAVLRA
jgi:hypothetical protein